MRLAPLYQQDRQLAIEQGRQVEGVSLILRLLNRRIGAIPANLVEQIRQLPIHLFRLRILLIQHHLLQWQHLL